jgi:hypothetical protein
MSAKREIRETAHAGGMVHTLVHLHHVITYGYDGLRRLTGKGKMKRRERVVGYHLVHGILISLGQVREALSILVELESSLRDAFAPFEEDLVRWTLFRDDAAHLIDRTHRVSLPGQHDARIGEDEYGYDTDLLPYDYGSDTVRTGADNTMVLKPEVDKVYEILSVAFERTVVGYREGTVKPPPRYREKN